jgi:drug/metabolite transporter (DMT)-like permease
MDAGLFLALLSAVFFAVGIVLVRKTAGAAGEAFTVTAISIFTGIPLFIIAICFSGGWENLSQITLKALIMLATAGIIHFVIGRLLAYDAFRVIGANKATPITQISPIFTVLLSWWLLQEKTTVYIIFGALLLMAGVILVTQEKSNPVGERKITRREEVKGILFSLGAAVCWGITPILIKPAVNDTGSSVVGNFISYAAAGIIMVLLSAVWGKWESFKRLSWKKNTVPMILAGLFTASGQLLYFTALQRSQANIVAPLVSIEVLFIYVVSYFINRKQEVFTLKIALGMVAMVAGTFLLFR